jgi:hypothetical protein
MSSKTKSQLASENAALGARVAELEKRESTITNGLLGRDLTDIDPGLDSLKISEMGSCFAIIYAKGILNVVTVARSL